MRISLLLIVAASYFSADFVFAQQARGRLDRKPGEVITRPDMQGGFPADRLEIGKPAPDFTLPRLAKSAGEKPGDVALKQLRATKPVVLIFGSITCPPFKGQLTGIDDVYESFRDRAEFLFVYVREAHPDSVLSVVGNSQSETLQKITQPKSLEERSSNAAICRQTLALKLPMAIDKPDNAVQLAYAGWPNRMVVVGTDGNVLFKSPVGPGSTNAGRLRSWLEANLP